jgi:hypothetical protein
MNEDQINTAAKRRDKILVHLYKRGPSTVQAIIVALRYRGGPRVHFKDNPPLISTSVMNRDIRVLREDDLVECLEFNDIQAKSAVKRKIISLTTKGKRSMSQRRVK